LTAFVTNCLPQTNILTPKKSTRINGKKNKKKKHIFSEVKSQESNIIHVYMRLVWW